MCEGMHNALAVFAHVQTCMCVKLLATERLKSLTCGCFLQTIFFFFQFVMHDSANKHCTHLVAVRCSVIQFHVV